MVSTGQVSQQSLGDSYIKTPLQMPDLGRAPETFTLRIKAPDWEQDMGLGPRGFKITIGWIHTMENAGYLGFFHKDESSSLKAKPRIRA